MRLAGWWSVDGVKLKLVALLSLMIMSFDLIVDQISLKNVRALNYHNFMVGTSWAHFDIGSGGLAEPAKFWPKSTQKCFSVDFADFFHFDGS